METSLEKDIQLHKVLVLGDVGTGKTSILRRYISDEYSIVFKSTLGINAPFKLINYDDNMDIKLHFWDVSGIERFRGNTQRYYKEASAVFITCDVNRPSTLDGVVKWKTDFNNKFTDFNSELIPIILLVNKIDLFDDPDSNIEKDNYCGKTHKEMNAFCKENKFIAWFPVSAKENINIDTAVNSLVTEILSNREKVSYDFNRRNTQ